MIGRGTTVRLVGVLLAAGLAVAGCSESRSAGSSSAAGGAAVDRGAVTSAPSAAPATGKAGAPSAGARTTVTARQVIYTGTVQLSSKDADAALHGAEAVATGLGGYIDAESAFGNGGTEGRTASVTLKIPTASFDTAYRQLLTLGTVVSQQRTAKDVTSDVVDLTSRLKTQRASVDRVRALMAQATSISAIVELESDLTQREADLESMESQLAALQDQVAMSTVTVTIQQPAVAAPAPAKHGRDVWQATGHAIAAGWHALYLVCRGILIALGAIAPFLLILVPVAALIWFLRRRERQAQVPLREEPPTE
jgi:hypothetical protein